MWNDPPPILRNLESSALAGRENFRYRGENFALVGERISAAQREFRGRCPRDLGSLSVADEICSQMVKMPHFVFSLVAKYGLFTIRGE